MICLAGCDKTIPGVTMALPRLNAVSVLENVITMFYEKENVECRRDFDKSYHKKII